MSKLGHVALVGAGPGHPGLITVRGLEVLRQADVVLYDKLVPGSLVGCAPAGAEVTCVSDLGACHTERFRLVEARLVEAARAGKRAVRLKGGDPSIFGRAGEEAEALAQAGIPFEVIPGVTAALGAAAFAGMPLTHRFHASAVAFVTGHENPGKPETLLDWANLASFPGTLVIYMGMSRLDRLVQSLLDHGKDAATPTAVVQDATTGAQRTVVAPLSGLPEAARRAGLAAPAVIVIGPVVQMHDNLDWFGRLPLFGQRVVITRPRHQAGEMAARLAALGAVPLLLPAVEVTPPDDWSPVDDAIGRLAEFDWLVFTSANGVAAFLDRLRCRGRDLRALGSVRLAAIGPRTAERLADYRLSADVVPERYQSEDLAAALLPRIAPGARVLLARADRGRPILNDMLASRARVEQVTVYRQVDAVPDDHPVLDQIRRGEVDYVTFTSSNIARAVLTRLDAVSRERIVLGRTRIVSISPVTTAAVHAAGLEAAAQAREATAEGVIEALVGLTSPRPAAEGLSTA